jgi:transcriptional regulator with XRE-family HTH domain
MRASVNGIEKIGPTQVRAARGLLNWSRDQLVSASGVPKRTLVRLEDDQGVPRASTLHAIRTALEAAGVEFTNGDAPGVRLRKPR